MLFDLRARGRRRTVQAVYLGLAGLMALGLVGFGIGGGFGGGGIFESLNSNNGSNSASFAAKVEAAEKRVKKHPTEPAAWAALTEARLKEAGGSEYYEVATNKYTSKGIEELHKASNAWTSYLQLNPKNPSSKIATRMLNVYAPAALNEPANAVQALQIVIASRPPSAALYSNLASFSYLSGNIREGDLASKKALALAPKKRRPLMELEFEKMKKSAEKESATSAATTEATAGGATSTTSSTTGSEGKKK